MVIKKGDIVARVSYNKDVLFIVDRILKMKNETKLAILKGIDVRIEADAPMDDLELVDKRIVAQNISYVENLINKRAEEIKKNNRGGRK